MGKGGQSSAKRVQKVDDNALIEQAIAQNRAEQEKRAAAEGARQEQKAAEAKAQQEQLSMAREQLTGVAGKGPQKPGKALTRDQIVEKLNAVPTFCLLNGQYNIVGLQDPEEPKVDVCFWMTDGADAKDMLEAAKAANPPDVADSLHLGVTPLGLAFALSEKWAETKFNGDMRLRGAREDAARGDNVGEMLRGQVEAQGLEQASWALPIFCCDELQGPAAMPMFLSRKALAETWVVSGRKLAELPQQQAVMDLRVLVAQMQTDAFAWETLHFITERKSVGLVKEAKEAKEAAAAARSGRPGPAAQPTQAAAAASAGAGDADDEPPPLE